MREIRTPWKPTPRSRRRWQKILVVVVGIGASMAASSELPDRECCDSAPPPPPHYLTVTSTSSSSTSQPPTHGGANVPREKEPLNCLLAKSLCDQDAKCSAILKVVPILCGPELVVCSTVTISRCQAALRTLVFFPWFVPTCLCREPRLDPQCNAFRDLLFDHPCNRKEVEIDLLPHIAACGRAADLCRDDLWCKPRLEQFRAACRFRDGHCRTRDRARCVEAWLQVRDTPLLGCICLEDGDKKCSRLYALVNHNPCVGDSYPSRVASMSGVSQALSTPLTRPVPVPTAAASLLVVSASHSDPLYPLSTIHHYLQHLPEEKTDEDVSLVQVRQIVGTCHVALTDCQADDGCSR
nr:uncharacterized protein LOC123748483 [Procambarus clarkii]